MNMPYAQKAAPLSYAEGARFDRAVQALAPDQRKALFASINDHLTKRNIESLQRRGQYLYLTITGEDGPAVGIYDFGVTHSAQSCLTALTDCLRSKRSPVRVLMPTEA